MYWSPNFPGDLKSCALFWSGPRNGPTSYQNATGTGADFAHFGAWDTHPWPLCQQAGTFPHTQLLWLKSSLSQHRPHAVFHCLLLRSDNSLKSSCAETCMSAFYSTAVQMKRVKEYKQQVFPNLLLVAEAGQGILIRAAMLAHLRRAAMSS